MTIHEWLFVAVIVLNYIVIYSIGYNRGYSKSKAEAPSDEAWIEVQKYEADKQWEAIERWRQEEERRKSDD